MSARRYRGSERGAGSGVRDWLEFRGARRVAFDGPTSCCVSVAGHALDVVARPRLWRSASSRTSRAQDPRRRTRRGSPCSVARRRSSAGSGVGTCAASAPNACSQDLDRGVASRASWAVLAVRAAARHDAPGGRARAAPCRRSPAARGRAWWTASSDRRDHPSASPLGAPAPTACAMAPRARHHDAVDRFSATRTSTTPSTPRAMVRLDATHGQPTWWTRETVLLTCAVWFSTRDPLWLETIVVAASGLAEAIAADLGGRTSTIRCDVAVPFMSSSAAVRTLDTGATSGATRAARRTVEGTLGPFRRQRHRTVSSKGASASDELGPERELALGKRAASVGTFHTSAQPSSRDGPRPASRTRPLRRHTRLQERRDPAR